MTILVLGATGTLGPHVVAALTAQATPVRALARDGDRARVLLPTGVDVRTGDPGNRAGRRGGRESDRRRRDQLHRRT